MLLEQFLVYQLTQVILIELNLRNISYGAFISSLSFRERIILLPPKFSQEEVELQQLLVDTLDTR